MTRTELQQAIKVIRQTDGTAQTPALNSKTTVLQDWLDNYNETNARQQSALDEWEELENSEATTEASEALPQVDPFTGRDINWMPELDEYEQYKANMMENCASAEYYDNGVVQYFDSERLYCVLPGYQEIINDDFYYEVVALPTLSNFEGIENEVMTVTDWTAATPLTCPIQSFQVCDLPTNYKVVVQFENDEYIATSGNGQGFGNTQEKAITALFESDCELETIKKQVMNTRTISQENLQCPHCQTTHLDIDKWALKPHKTHLCLNCGELFEGTFKGVSHPTFTDEFQITEKVGFINGRVKTYIVNSDIKIVLNQTIEREPELYIMDCEDNEHGYLEGCLAEDLYSDVVNSDESDALDLLAEHV